MFVRLSALSLLLSLWCLGQSPDSIQPWNQNPSYWQFRGKPVLLLGASDDDNLFQWPADLLKPHLDAMQAVGANYVRNTMSDRRDRGFELYPYLKLPSGKYDLGQWNPEYWQRFVQFLDWTAERGIVVQIEVWDRFDYSQQHWQPNPYNPKNNVNYSHEESGLASEYLKHPGSNEQPFFFTTPEQRNNALLLRVQQRFVDKMLSYSLRHGHVLYCMDNETHAEPAWGRFWATYIKAKAKDQGKQVFATEMWDKWDIKSDEHRATLDHPELYDFVDVSQNSHNKGDVHWGNALWVKEYVKTKPRPVNTVKTYGADGGRYGSNQDGLERVFRHVLAGFATARFHRPPAGLGIHPSAQGAVKAIRLLESRMAAWEWKPAMELLAEREPNEAYAVTNGKGINAVYFTDGGVITLRVPEGDYQLQWIEANKGEWQQTVAIKAGAEGARVQAPGSAHWIAVVQRK